jgi:type I restriction enzyme S subunit
MSTNKQKSKAARSTSRAQWPTVFLGDVVESMKNGIYKKREAYAGDGVACLRMYNIDSGQIVWRDIKRMRLDATELQDYRLLPGDLLVNRVNSRELVGKAAVIPDGIEPTVFESKNIRVRVERAKADPQFISLQLLLSGSSYFAQNAQQVVGMASISQPQIARFPIVLPSLPEQRRIVAEIEKQFTRLEVGVAALKRVQAGLKRYRAALLKAACEGKLVPTEAELARKERRSYETGAQLLARILAERRKNWKGRSQYKEPAAPDTTNLPNLPEGWTWACLDQLLGMMRNGISAKPDAESGLPILRISAVRALSVNVAESRYLNAKASDYPDYALEEGDLLFTRYNGNPKLVGVCGVVPTLTSPLVHPDKLIRCKLVVSGALPDFVAVMANVGASREYLAKRVRTTAGQAGVSGGDLKGLPIPLAPLAEQAGIVAEVERRLSVVEELEAVVSTNLQRAARLRQSILQQAFSGGLA